MSFQGGKCIFQKFPVGQRDIHDRMDLFRNGEIQKAGNGKGAGNGYKLILLPGGGSNPDTLPVLDVSAIREVTRAL